MMYRCCCDDDDDDDGDDDDDDVVKVGLQTVEYSMWSDIPGEGEVCVWGGACVGVCV